MRLIDRDCSLIDRYIDNRDEQTAIFGNYIAGNSLTLGKRSQEAPLSCGHVSCYGIWCRMRSSSPNLS